MLEVHSYTHAVLEALQSRDAPIRDSSVTGDSMSAMSAERLPIRLEATYITHAWALDGPLYSEILKGLQSYLNDAVPNIKS